MPFGPVLAPKRVHTTLHPAAIQSLFLPGGSAHRKASDIQRDVRTQARRAAPKRSGMLRRSIQSDRVGTNQYGNNFSVYSYAAHSAFVEYGTFGVGGWIYPHANKGGLRVHPAYGGHPVSVQRRVKGQDAKPFMHRGLERAFVLNGLL